MSSEAVRVIVRCRPINDREFQLKCETVIDVSGPTGQIQIIKPTTIRSPGSPAQSEPKSFTFDAAYGTDSQTEQIYEEVGLPLVGSVLDGYNGTVFAYGQTGCGKSFTMSGITEPESQKGIIPRAFQHIFQEMDVSEDSKYLVYASYLEIYNEEVRDLLGKDSKAKLDLKEHPDKGVYVQNLSTHRIAKIIDLEKLMDQGSKNRSVGATLMNADSSRSHSIFTVVVEIADNTGIRSGKLNLVDLAGSERQSKTGSTGERLREATRINLSLSALGNVISALVDGRSKHIPYRDSKLTRLLQSSLGGNTKTLMVACISPADNNYEETLSTLRYANRAKNIKNQPRINEDPKDALIRQYQEEIMKLKELLEKGIAPTINGSIMNDRSNYEEMLETERNRIKAEYEEEMCKLKEKYAAEHESSERLQQELNELQQNYNQQLTNLDNNSNAANTESNGTDNAINNTELGKLFSNLQSNSANANSNTGNSPETILAQIVALQEAMIGGGKKEDSQLKQSLSERKHKAKRRSDVINNSKLSEDWDGDYIIEGVFQSLSDELSYQRQRADKAKSRFLAAQEEVSDLQAEFEEERSDLCDVVRNLERHSNLQNMIIARLASCIRRDCNYYNIDMVLAQCHWAEDNGQWIIPPLSVEKLVLPATSDNHVNYLQGGGNAVYPTIYEQPSDTHLLEQLNRAESPTENFKPKRANKLLQDATNYIENFNEIRTQDELRYASSPKPFHNTHVQPLTNTNSLSAAKIHGISLPKIDYNRKPHKLESLNHHQVPTSLSDNSMISNHSDNIIDNLPPMEKKSFPRNNFNHL